MMMDRVLTMSFETIPIPIHVSPGTWIYVPPTKKQRTKIRVCFFVGEQQYCEEYEYRCD